MTGSDRLRPIQHVAEVRERDAARAFGESQRRLEEEQQRLSQLEAYRDEYLQRFRRLQQEGLTVAQLLEYQAFLAKLDAAVRHQAEIVQLRRGDAERRRAAWTDRRTHSRAMERAVDNLADRELQDGERREQKALDDRNQRRR
jgi:flagellar FliJ protein